MTAADNPSGDGRLEDVIRADVPHSARIYNFWLGGKDHYDIDRMVGEQVIQAEPGFVEQMRENRAFLGRVVEYLVRECGIRQFLDIGTGLPTADNTHEVAQRIAPDSRIVYVDNDPIVLVHARALLTSTPEGVTDYIDADMREPEKIFAAAAKTLDFDKPVAVMMLGIFNHIGDDAEARSLIGAIMDGTCPGSYLAISVNTNVVNKENMDRAAASYNEAFGNPPIHMLTPERFTGHFTGLELVEPGVVSASRWLAPGTAPSGEERPEMDLFVAVGRKP
ncbi:SAM-dependent methyltransferase [Actinomadura sp. 7K507]|uniref:SAM-dependent methyltransferase n=1 Tax=Actinomadura sp. 7K507 TaxID=2530365 RepID=UPI00104F96A1|nr:SAM-dependent methyltransferase [Actinomadura sp. 7K507]TDC76906.1 SAM-dependent methyltransferase [Actinomadura sp. 7K507]